MNDSNFPSDLTGHLDVPPAEVALLLELASQEMAEQPFRALTLLLMNRSLNLLREGSRQELLAEAMMINRFLEIEAGRRLRERQPEVFGRWSALGAMLSGASRASNRAAVPSILKGGRGQEVLDLLAARGGAVPRAEIRREIGLSEAHLSHLLADLEEARLILRYRPQGSKEVLVELGPVGRERMGGAVAGTPSLPAKTDSETMEIPESVRRFLGPDRVADMIRRQGNRRPVALFESPSGAAA